MISRHYRTCLAADIVEFFHRYNVFVRSYLQNAVSGSIDDKISGLHMFFAVIADDISAAVRLVAEYPAARDSLKRIEDFFGESVRICGKRLV